MKRKSVKYNTPELERCSVCGITTVPYKYYNKGAVCYSCANKHPKFVQVKRTEPKIGRNEKCSCGSGKKNKHCCNKDN